jgi:rhodanese-related sulfurtransferase
MKERRMVKIVTAQTAFEMMQNGAALIDIREADERARMHIPGSEHRPLGALQAEGLAAAGPVIFHCRTGLRTQSNAQALCACVGEENVHVLEGGLEAWRAAGLAVRENRKRPIEIMRQVQITAGLLILIGVVLGWQVHAGFYGLAALVGAGLTFAGISGSCMMARLLSLMPWNRAAV